MEMEDDYQGSLECVFENLTITTKNLSFSYPGSEKLVLDSVNMNINDNKKIALIGPNGAGKTTLVKLLIGLFPPQNGVILYNQDDLTEISRYQLYDRVAVIPQNFNIYEFTIAENLLMREYTEEDETNVKTVLQRIGLYEKVQALKNKENTVLGKMFEENGTEFSGGEKQKIAIGRALIREPEIIIMDEATASLDPLAEKEIIDLSMELFKDKKMIIISHRLSMALQTDYIYLLDEGKIAEEGTHNELMEIKGKYYELFTTLLQNTVWKMNMELQKRVIEICCQKQGCFKTKVNGDCMYPFIRNGESVSVFSYSDKEPMVGDIVLILINKDMYVHRLLKIRTVVS